MKRGISGWGEGLVYGEWFSGSGGGLVYGERV